MRSSGHRCFPSSDPLRSIVFPHLQSPIYMRTFVFYHKPPGLPVYHNLCSIIWLPVYHNLFERHFPQIRVVLLKSKETEVGYPEENKMHRHICLRGGYGVVLLWEKAWKVIPYSWRRGSRLQRFPLCGRMYGKRKGEGFMLFSIQDHQALGWRYLCQKRCKKAAGLLLSTVQVLPPLLPFLSSPP